MTAVKTEFQPHPASYRDPSGFVFRYDGQWYRQVNASYEPHYRQLMHSGLYAELTRQELLLPYREIEENITGHPYWFKTLLPEQLSLIAYPEEWSPAQLKKAALCTLAISRMAITHGMILKDATPRNIQFVRGKAMLIDSLSFETYDPSLPWVAYRQFCECFLYPLYLQHYQGEGTHRTIIAWPDGIEAAAVAKALPFRSRRNLGVWLHVLLPARVKKSGRSSSAAASGFDKNKMIHLLANLESIIRDLPTDASGAAGWSQYYEKTILSQAYLQEKEKLFRQYLEKIAFSSALDLGANDGYFSWILAEKQASVVAVDSAWQCIDNLVNQLAARKGKNILPLCVDLANPTPATGFMNAERLPFTSRFRSSLVTALALVHHLSLGRNIPLSLVADFFSRLTADNLIIEFVPQSDPKARELLAGRTITGYDKESFESCFGRHYIIETQSSIPGTDRILYLMKKRSA
jgi:hypothetical protein